MFRLSLMVLACEAVYTVFVVCNARIMLKYVDFSMFFSTMSVKKNVE